MNIARSTYTLWRQIPCLNWSKGKFSLTSYREGRQQHVQPLFHTQRCKFIMIPHILYCINLAITLFLQEVLKLWTFRCKHKDNTALAFERTRLVTERCVKQHCNWSEERKGKHAVDKMQLVWVGFIAKLSARVARLLIARCTFAPTVRVRLW